MILESIYFIGPAYFANMAPVIAKRMRIFKELDKPIDNNTKLNDGKPFFGKHKTYRGLIVGVVFAIIIAFIQKLLYAIPFFRSISITNYDSFLLLGFLLGLGAIIGDMMKSFVKRRVNIKPGAKFIPFDQIDFVLGAYLFVLIPFSSILTWEIFLFSIIISFFLHIAVNHLAFYLKIRKEKW